MLKKPSPMKSHIENQDPSLFYEFLKELFILFIKREMVFLTCLYEILTLDQNIWNFLFILFASFKNWLFYIMYEMWAKAIHHVPFYGI